MNTYTLKIGRRVTSLRRIEQENAENRRVPVSVLADPVSTESLQPTDQKVVEETIEEYKNRIANLEATLQTAREESFNAGFEEGKDIGIKEIKIQIDNLSKEFISTTGSLEEQYRQTLSKLRKPLVKLAVKIASKIIGMELQHEEVYDRVVTHQVRKLLSEVTDQNKITIYLNPEQHHRISSIEKEGELPIPEHVNLISKEDVMPGECLLESDDYMIEGLISRQLQNIEDRMLSEEML